MSPSRMLYQLIYSPRTLEPQSVNPVTLVAEFTSSYRMPI